MTPGSPSTWVGWHSDQYSVGASRKEARTRSRGFKWTPWRLAPDPLASPATGPQFVNIGRMMSEHSMLQTLGSTTHAVSGQHICETYDGGPYTEHCHPM